MICKINPAPNEENDKNLFTVLQNQNIEALAPAGADLEKDPTIVSRILKQQQDDSKAYRPGDGNGCY